MPAPSTSAALFSAALRDAAELVHIPHCCVLLQPATVPASVLASAPAILSTRSPYPAQQQGQLSWLLGYARDALDELQFMWACLAVLAAAHAFSDADINLELNSGFTKEKRKALQYGTTTLASLLSTADGRSALGAYVLNPLFAWSVFRSRRR